jgi:SAM-dependent methyltransferase
MQDDGYFDDSIAKSYDEDHGGTDPALIEQTVDILHGLADDGDVLEFAIGTGRIAIPLAERGCKVRGIELSRAMVAELRKKENGSSIPIAIGDMTTTRVEGDFSLVFLVFNTIDNLVTQDAQVACFGNAADHLAPGGRFLVETQVPPIQKIPFGETRHAFACSPEHMGVDVIDIVSQRYTSNHVWMEDGEYRQVTIPFRYAWPSELDLMAKLAGLVLEHRWSDWDKSPFSHLSTRHISILRKPAPGRRSGATLVR